MSHQERLLELWGEIADVHNAMEVLDWDEETQMPPNGTQSRGKVLSTLAGIAHAKLSAPELREVVAACEEEAEPDSVLAAQVREAKRQIDRVARVPASLAKEIAEASSHAKALWKEARRKSDFSIFRDALARNIDLKKREAEAIGGSDSRPFDVLLNDFEPGSTEEELIPLFESLKAELSPLIKEVADSGKTIDESAAKGHFPEAAQLAFGQEVVEHMGFDMDAGRIDLAAHPFCSGFGPGDVRITWRWQHDDFRPALYGLMHEAGHGLYEQGLPEQWTRSPIGGAVSLGVHESQSRLWENLVGRSRSFWQWVLPRFKKYFPDKIDISVDDMWPALHTANPSFIRVEADEATYNLHIAIRFDIERAIFAGDLKVDDLPKAWDDAYEELLGIRPANVAEGVLQDIHWSMAGFGYFPTYTLGNLINAQLFVAAREQLGDLDEQFARGELAPLLGWLREHVHQWGSRYTASELVEKATGKPLSSDAFLMHIRSTTREAYGLA